MASDKFEEFRKKFQRDLFSSKTVTRKMSEKEKIEALMMETRRLEEKIARQKARRAEEKTDYDRRLMQSRSQVSKSQRTMEEGRNSQISAGTGASQQGPQDSLAQAMFQISHTL